MNSISSKYITKPLCSLLSLSILLSPLGNLAYAATTIALPNAPLAVSSKVKPNVLYTLDNSGSMAWETVTGYDGTGEYRGGNADTNAFYANSYNQIYYDPAVTYTPAVTWQNISMGNAPKTAANNNPFIAGQGTIDLTPTCVGATDSATDTTNIVNKKGVVIGTTTVDAPLPTSANCAAGTTRAKYAYYYLWDGATSIANNAPVNAAFPGRIDIIPGRTYPRPTTANPSGLKPATRTDCITIPTVANPTQCSYDEEIQNFANWYSYYRTRILMTKTVLGQVFGAIDQNTSSTNPPQFRVGFQTIDNASGDNASVTNGAYWLDIADYDATQKQTFFNTLYAITPTVGTPLRYAADRAGKLFSGTLTSGTTKAKDPVQYSCQQNYQILSTDGFWNEETLPSLPASNLDGAANITLPEKVKGSAGTLIGPTIPVARPYFDGSNTANTLSDVTYYYWATDLRKTGGACTNNGVDLCTKNNVPPNDKDPATWQHMTTYTVGLGANGKLDYQNSLDSNGFYSVTPKGDYAAILNGTKNWPAIPTTGTNQGNIPETIDDLWHAAINGHGIYFNAGDPSNLKRGLTNALLDISGRSQSGAGFTLDAAGIGDSTGAFVVKYDSATWSGSLAAQQVTLDTSGNLQFSTKWDARDKITAQASGTGWDTVRKIVTFDGSNKIPFRFANLSAAQKANLGVTADQQDTVDYLRGKPIARFRARNFLLGDIVSSEAVVVGAPKENYKDGLGNTGYEAWKSGKLGRESRIYVGANDGMLHAIDPDIAASDLTTGPGGKELWAYVSNLLFAGPNNTPAIDGLQALTKSSLFQHHFYVDQTPVYKDVDFARTKGVTTATPDWHTILVGGLNKGGKGFYALDITDPNPASTEAATATAKVLWEFTDPDMGYSFGQPQIAKTRKHGWVVFVSSGYNNTGNGYLYVLDVKTGALLEKISTGADAGGGMTEVTGWVPSAGDYTAEQVYGGDLNGNLWRFDVSQAASNTAAFPAPVKMATLTDSGGKAQPITTAPRIDLVGQDRWVVVGTGKMLSVGDELDKQQQSMYVFKDGNKALPYVNPGDTSGAPILPYGQTFPLAMRSANLVSISDADLINNNTGNLAGKMGWYHDLTGVDNGTGGSGGTEKIHITPIVKSGLVAWSTALPQIADACTNSLKGRVYAAGIADAQSRVLSGSGLGSAKMSFSAQDSDVIKLRVVSAKDGKDRLLAQTVDGKITSIDANLSPGSNGAKRLNWREIK
jgi:type IV pilus assembly protein PilY1